MRPQRHLPRRRHRANDALSIRSSRLYYLTKCHTSVHFYPQNAQVFLVDNFVHKQLYIDFLLTFTHKMLYNSTRSGTEPQTLTKARRRAEKGE